MSPVVRYLTHPQVQIDSRVPVPQWSLSAEGRARAVQVAKAEWLSSTTQIISSCEQKALETAELLAAELGVEVEKRNAMHENDRSSTGFLPPSEFDAMVDEFFAQPMVSVRGWERAIDAQLRIVREVEEVLARGIPGDVLFVGHGAVGTLLFCHYADQPINRAYDQPAGGGYYFGLIAEGRRIQHAWRQMEDPPPG